MTPAGPRFNDDTRHRVASVGSATLVGLAGLALAELLVEHRILSVLAAVALHQFLQPILTAHLITLTF